MDKIRKAFQTLADSNRLKIISAISEADMSVGELVKATSLSQPLVSFHLKVLKQNGFMTTTRKGPFIYYSVRDVRLLKAIDVFVEIFDERDANTKESITFCASCRDQE